MPFNKGIYIWLCLGLKAALAFKFLPLYYEIMILVIVKVSRDIHTMNYFMLQ